MMPTTHNKIQQDGSRMANSIFNSQSDHANSTKNRKNSNTTMDDDTHDAGGSALDVSYEWIGSGSRFLGLLDRRYVGSICGAIHGVTSFTSLALSNWLFVQMVLRGGNPNQHGNNNSNDDDNSNGNDWIFVLCFVSSFLSGATLLPVWNKVQSWQLSTTTRHQKGLTCRQLQRLNQGRGVITPMLKSIYPLVLSFYYFPHENDNTNTIKNVLFSSDQTEILFSIVLATSVLALCYHQYTLICDYGRVIWTVYGVAPMCFAVSILYSGLSLSQFKSGDIWVAAGGGGSLRTLLESHPYALDYLYLDAVFTLACIQFGFLWYYLYSRRLATQTQVQRACGIYHPIMLVLWVSRILCDQLRQDHSLPIAMAWIPWMFTFLLFLFALKLLHKGWKSMEAAVKAEGASSHTLVVAHRGVRDTSDVVVTNTNQDGQSTATTTTFVSGEEELPTEQPRRRSSFLEVQDEVTKRRSSVFEAIDVCLVSIAVASVDDDDRKEEEMDDDDIDCNDDDEKE